jgi:hypothetical protein
MTAAAQRMQDEAIRVRRQIVDRLYIELADSDCEIGIQSPNGISVQLFSHSIRDVEGGCLVFKHFTDQQFDDMMIADSDSARKMCWSIHHALKILKPIIEQQAVDGFKQKVRELFA